MKMCNIGIYHAELSSRAGKVTTGVGWIFVDIKNTFFLIIRA